jgi:hypothetical protein
MSWMRRDQALCSKWMKLTEPLVSEPLFAAEESSELTCPLARESASNEVAA